MKILFLTIVNIKTLQERGIYQDLLRQFTKNGHQVYVVAPTERRNKEGTKVVFERGATVLRVRTLNLQKTNIIEKGLATISLETKFANAIKKYFKGIKFDLVLYSTPPITFAKVVQYIKKRDHAKTYLLLKDIFPQNAVDIGLMQKTGLKGIIYRYFRKKEKKLYALSDKIGCMSQANCDFVLKHNPEIPQEKVEICPNSIEYRDLSLNETERNVMREKYGIPLDKKVFVYGGNLGKPQGIPFIIDCLKTQEQNEEVFFLIVGDGTEFGKLQTYFDQNKPRNMKLMKRLPKEDYDRMIAACDVGMIFLDHRFTIPNFPSRLLSYMQAGLPVIACTDPNTDIGKVIVEGGFGWWCESNDVSAFEKCIEIVLDSDCSMLGENAKRYLEKEYSVKYGYEIILKSYERFNGLKMVNETGKGL